MYQALICGIVRAGTTANINQDQPFSGAFSGLWCVEWSLPFIEYSWITFKLFESNCYTLEIIEFLFLEFY